MALHILTDDERRILLVDARIIRDISRQIREHGESAVEKHRSITRRMEEIIVNDEKPSMFFSSSHVACICHLCRHRSVRRYDEVYRAFPQDADAKAYIRAACVEKYQAELMQQPLKAHFTDHSL